MALAYPEYGRLRRALVHHPGNELDLVTPTRYRQFLFEDAVDPVLFRQQHERFVDALRSEGVDVLLLGEVLSKDRDFKRAAEKQPNLVYTRDTAIVTQAGYFSTRMRSAVRDGEPRMVAKALIQLGITELDSARAPATIEGGDVIFRDENTVFLGLKNRTNLAGFRQLQRAAVEMGISRLITIELPSGVTHLDGTMMVLDDDLAIVHRKSLKGSANLHEGNAKKSLRFLEFLEKSGFRIVEVTDYERRRRATNMVGLNRRKVVGYGGNSRVRKELERVGVDFIEIPESELVRGGAGPRCMTLPLLRE